ncbi:MAG: hypothetical protein ABJ013_06510 [Halioglobus sp.]
MDNTENVLSSPDWLLSGVNSEREAFIFTNVHRRSLDAMAFHDGRTPLRQKVNSVTVDFEDALNWQRGYARPDSPLQLINHTAFCGSTLLSRMLATAPEVACYREPQVLVELADLKACGHSLSHEPAFWGEIVHFSLQQFTQAWEGQSAAVLKPSNWANTLLSDITLRMPVRAVLMTCDIEDYLLAHLRGGRERIAFSLRLLNHMALCSQNLQGRIDTLEEQYPNGLSNILHLLALNLQAQQELLVGHSQLNEWDTMELTKHALLNQPVTSIIHTASALGLKSNWYSSTRLKEITRVNAKVDVQSGYSASEESLQNSWLSREYDLEIRAACDWFYQSTLSPQTTPINPANLIPDQSRQ